MKLHTFGDSHSHIGWEFSIPKLSIQHGMCGPYTMSRFGTEKLNFLNIKKVNVNEGDGVCFCFGEIDCRTHICKQENFKMREDLMNEITFRYFEAIKANVDQYMNLTTMILSIVPTPTKINTIENREYPFVGTDDERKDITLYMNSKLKEYCEKYGYMFLNVYEKYCDENGFLNKELSDGHVHIKNGCYIQEFLEKTI